MNAPAVSIDAIRCQIRRVVEVALANDRARLPIRAALRDALHAVERDKLVVKFSDGRRA